jgi:hypothetical protein
MLIGSVNRAIRRDLSHATYVSGLEKITQRDFVAHIGLIWTELFSDDKKGETVLKFIKSDRLGTLNVVKERGKFFLEMEARDKIITEMDKNLDAGFIRSENAILKSTEENLVNIPQVQTSMSVLGKIIRWVNRENHIVPAQVPCRPSKRTPQVAKANRYLRLLRDLRILAQEGDAYVPGPTMKDMADRSSDNADIFHQVMAEIYSRGYTYMRKELHLTGIVPYLRATHSYYLPSHSYGQLLSMTGERITENLVHFYPGSQRYANDEITVNNWFDELDEVNVLVRDSKFLRGNEDIMKSYESNLRASSSRFFAS